jgi:predicted DsbA family dithiol-disulfide isomerase
LIVQLEVWSDIACPWCYVGKRRLEAALASFEHRAEVSVIWRSFELDPGAPPERPGDRHAHLAAKYGTTLEQARAMHDRMKAIGAADCIEFRFDVARLSSSFDAHRLLHLAAAHGRQGDMKERLMRAHFTDGEPISDHATLARLARDAGLPEDETATTLATDRFAADVREDEATAQRLGIRGVPFFVVDRKLAVSGAQPPEVLGELLRRGFEARTPAAA